MPVFRRKQRGHFHAARDHRVHIAMTVAIDTGVIGDQPHALALERREILLFEHIQTGEHRVIRFNRPPAAERFVVIH